MISGQDIVHAERCGVSQSIHYSTPHFIVYKHLILCYTQWQAAYFANRPSKFWQRLLSFYRLIPIDFYLELHSNRKSSYPLCLLDYIFLRNIALVAEGAENSINFLIKI